MYFTRQKKNLNRTRCTFCEYHAIKQNLPCPKHKNLKCVGCNSLATQRCSKFCGNNICDKCQHYGSKEGDHGPFDILKIVNFLSKYFGDKIENLTIKLDELDKHYDILHRDFVSRNANEIIEAMRKGGEMATKKKTKKTTKKKK